MNIKQHITQLQEWSGYSNFTILYNNEMEELSARTINSKISGKRNLYFIIEDINNNIFGSYHSIIPNEKEYKQHSSEDPKHFIFTLQNPFSIQPSKYYPTQHNDHVLYLYQNYDINNVLNVQYCYGIVSQNRVFLYENIINYYQNIPRECGCRFLTGNVNYFTEIKHFIILEMK